MHVDDQLILSRISVAILGIFISLAYALTKLNTIGRGGFQFLWDLGLGTVNGFTLITGWNLPTSGDGAIISAVLIANLPQTLFSTLYVLINSLFTTLSIAVEWSRYANRSAPFRVSSRRGKQRSTYFLQLPYRIAIPLTVLSTLVHWTMSLSLSFSQVEAKDPTGEINVQDGATTCSYSPLGMILTAIAGFALIGFAVALGWRKLPSGIPLAGSCSLAISAACHSPEGTSELLPVMWGAIPDMTIEYAEDGTRVGHCAFSNGPIESPIEGNLYA